MAKRKPQVKMRSYGIYQKWDADSKDLPRVVEFTTEIPATIDIEFGFVIQITGAKNKELAYCIDRPGILDDEGNRRDPFDGSVYVRSNDWQFYLGDTIWAPISDKLGEWHMWIELDGQVIAEKTFDVFDEDEPEWLEGA